MKIPKRFERPVKRAFGVWDSAAFPPDRVYRTLYALGMLAAHRRSYCGDMPDPPSVGAIEFMLGRPNLAGVPEIEPFYTYNRNETVRLARVRNYKRFIAWVIENYPPLAELAAAVEAEVLLCHA